jgi:hypothetical protein
MVSLQTLRGVGVACVTSWVRGAFVELKAERGVTLEHMTVLLGSDLRIGGTALCSLEKDHDR